MANTTAAEFWMVPDSAFHYRSICYCDKILKQHLRDASGPRCWQIWPGFCMLIAGFTLVFHVNMCDKPVIQVDVVGPLDFPQQFRKNQNSQWSWLSMNFGVASLLELPTCFVKQGPSFIPCKLLPRKTKMGDIIIHFGLRRAHAALQKLREGR